MHVQFEAALARLESGSGRRHPLFVAGADREPADWATRHSPIDTNLVLGEFPLADTPTSTPPCRPRMRPFPPGARARPPSARALLRRPAT
jgi:1-pyrroline-5-carboxylate dehydrogenase